MKKSLTAKWFRHFLAVVAVGLAVAATAQPAADAPSDDTQSETSREERRPRARQRAEGETGGRRPGGQQGGERAPAAETVLAALKASEKHTTLTRLVAAAGLEEALSAADGRITLFAPTDEAFEKLGAEKLAELEADPEALAKVLKGHVSTAENAFGTMRSGGTIEMLNGDTVTVVREDNVVTVGGAKRAGRTSMARNGRVLAVDAILTPNVPGAVDEAAPKAEEIKAAVEEGVEDAKGKAKEAKEKGEAKEEEVKEAEKKKAEDGDR